MKRKTRNYKNWQVTFSEKFIYLLKFETMEPKIKSNNIFQERSSKAQIHWEFYIKKLIRGVRANKRYFCIFKILIYISYRLELQDMLKEFSFLKEWRVYLLERKNDRQEWKLPEMKICKLNKKNHLFILFYKICTDI